MSAEDKAEVSFTWGLGALPRFGEFGGMRLELEEYQELPSSTLRHAGVSPTPPPVPMPTAPSERPPAPSPCHSLLCGCSRALRGSRGHTHFALGRE